MACPVRQILECAARGARLGGGRKQHGRRRRRQHLVDRAESAGASDRQRISEDRGADFLRHTADIAVRAANCRVLLSRLRDEAGPKRQRSVRHLSGREQRVWRHRHHHGCARQCVCHRLHEFGGLSGDGGRGAEAERGPPRADNVFRGAWPVRTSGDPSRRRHLRSQVRARRNVALCDAAGRVGRGCPGLDRRGRIRLRLRGGHHLVHGFPGPVRWQRGTVRDGGRHVERAGAVHDVSTGPGCEIRGRRRGYRGRGLWRSVGGRESGAGARPTGGTIAASVSTGAIVPAEAFGRWREYSGGNRYSGHTVPPGVAGWRGQRICLRPRYGRPSAGAIGAAAGSTMLFGGRGVRNRDRRRGQRGRDPCPWAAFGLLGSLPDNGGDGAAGPADRSRYELWL
jgi:hypothetical protein